MPRTKTVQKNTHRMRISQRRRSHPPLRFLPERIRNRARHPANLGRALSLVSCRWRSHCPHSGPVTPAPAPHRLLVRTSPHSTVTSARPPNERNLLMRRFKRRVPRQPCCKNTLGVFLGVRTNSILLLIFSEAGSSSTIPPINRRRNFWNLNSPLPGFQFQFQKNGILELELNRVISPCKGVGPCPCRDLPEAHNARPSPSR